MTTNTNAAESGTFHLGGERRVNRLGFGAMRLPAGTFMGPARDPKTGLAVLRRAAELGVNHIDTAGFYGRDGVNAHELIREALSPYPEDLLIATKVGPLIDDSGAPGGKATPEQLRGLVEDDLRRLGLDRLDLVYLRIGGMLAPEEGPVADHFAALAELKDEGLIAHLGISNVTSAQLAEARAVAPVAAVQNHFHVHHRADDALLAECDELGIASVPFFPLGGGNESVDGDRLADVAARHGATASQIALAWMLTASPNLLAIPGTGSLDHLEENIGAAAISLTSDDLTELAG